MSKQAGCFLCEALQAGDDRNRLILFRGKTCALIMNRYPYNNGHLMVMPHRHIDSVEKMSAPEQAELMEITGRACGWLRQVMRPDGFNIGINQGAAAGAGLEEHIHLHIVPRWHNDTNFMPVLADTKVIPQALDDLWQRLRAVIVPEAAAK